MQPLNKLILAVAVFVLGTLGGSAAFVAPAGRLNNFVRPTSFPRIRFWRAEDGGSRPDMVEPFGHKANINTNDKTKKNGCWEFSKKPGKGSCLNRNSIANSFCVRPVEALEFSPSGNGWWRFDLFGGPDCGESDLLFRGKKGMYFFNESEALEDWNMVGSQIESFKFV